MNKKRTAAESASETAPAAEEAQVAEEVAPADNAEEPEVTKKAKTTEE